MIPSQLIQTTNIFLPQRNTCHHHFNVFRFIPPNFPKEPKNNNNNTMNPTNSIHSTTNTSPHFLFWYRVIISLPSFSLRRISILVSVFLFKVSVFYNTIRKWILYFQSHLIMATSTKPLLN